MLIPYETGSLQLVDSHVMSRGGDLVSCFKCHMCVLSLGMVHHSLSELYFIWLLLGVLCVFC
jgi:hypothetical protein